MNQERAFLEAFDLYAEALYRHAYFRISSHDRAQDLVSDVFMRTWDYIVKGNDVKDFRPFLYRTLNHLIIDEYRKKRTESLDALLDDAEVPQSAFEELVEGSREELEMRIDAQKVPEMLKSMPNQYREVIVMRYFDGLMPAEIADVLEQSVNSVSVRIHRGIAWLAKNIDTKR